jgi:hypothetical protein
MSFPIGSGAYLQHALGNGAPSILAMGAQAKQRVSYQKQRCRELGLAHDGNGVPRLRTDAERLANAKTPEHRAKLLAKIARERAGRIRRDRAQADARIDAFAARMVATASQAARTDPSMAMLNKAERRPALDKPQDLPPLPDPLAPQRVAEVEARNLPASCMTCTHRRPLNESTELSFGYCDKGDTGRGTCDGMTRECPSCDQDKPQAGWGLGFKTTAGGLGVTAAWVCGDCRHDKAKVDAQAARGKRFTVVLDIDPMSRYKLAGEFERGSGLAVGAVCRPLLRIVAALKDSDWSGQIDIDLEDDQEASELESCEIVMRNSLDRTYGATFAAGDRLVRAFADFRWAGEPPKPPARVRLTDAELSALQHGERPITSD